MIRHSAFLLILICGFLQSSLTLARDLTTASSAVKPTGKSTSLIFPTEEQFLALSDAQQIQYLRGLQEITSQMVHNSSLFAEYRNHYLQYLALATGSKAYAADVSQAVSEAKRQFTEFKQAPSSENGEEKNRLAVEAFAKLSRAFDEANREDDRAAKSEVLRNYRELQRQVKSSSDSLSPKTLSYIESQGDRMQKTVSNPPRKSSSQPQPHSQSQSRPASRQSQSPPRAPKAKVESPTPLARQPVSESRKNVATLAAGTGSTAHRTEKADKVAASSRDTAPPKSSPPPPAAPAPPAPSPAATPATAKPTENTYTRSGCMYAGFVLITDRCDAPYVLPEQFKGKTPFDEDKFRCEKGQAICNPLLFGFDIKAPEAAEKNCEDISQISSCYQYAVPVCIPVSRTATKDCKAKTDSEKYLKRAQALIKAKKDLFTKFTEDFRTICDKDFIDQNKLIHYDSSGKKRNNPEYYKNDILSTCERAAPQLESLYESTIGSKFNYKAAAAKGSTAGGATSGTTGGANGSNQAPKSQPPSAASAPASGASANPGKK